MANVIDATLIVVGPEEDISSFATSTFAPAARDYEGARPEGLGAPWPSYGEIKIERLGVDALRYDWGLKYPAPHERVFEASEAYPRLRFTTILSEDTIGFMSKLVVVAATETAREDIAPGTPKDTTPEEQWAHIGATFERWLDEALR